MRRRSKLLCGVVLLVGMWPAVLVHAASPSPLASPNIPIDQTSQSAQGNPLNLTVSPTVLTLSAKPGNTFSTDIRVKNNGIAPEALRLGVIKFAANNTSGEPVLQSRQKNDDFLNWVSFSAPVFSAQPGEWKTITATFKLPTTAAFGYYYAIVVTRQSQPIDTGSRQIGVIGAPSLLVLLAVEAPGAKREAQMASFYASRQWYEFLPAQFSVEIQNSGNVHVAPHGDIFVSRGGQDGADGGRDIATLPINDDQGQILPSSKRTFQASWTAGFPRFEPRQVDGQPVLDKQGNLKMHLVWHWNDIGQFRFGRYTAHLTLVYDNGNQDVPIEATLNFWIIPWRLLLAAVFIAAGLIWSLFSLLRRFKRLFRHAD